MSKVLIHPELIDLFTTLRIADIDYEDNRGSSNAHEFADLARRAQRAFRERKAELEAEGVPIWRDEISSDEVTPNGEVRGASRLAGEASSAEGATSTVVLERDGRNGEGA